MPAGFRIQVVSDYPVSKESYVDKCMAVPGASSADCFLEYPEISNGVCTHDLFESTSIEKVSFCKSYDLHTCGNKNEKDCVYNFFPDIMLKNKC